MSSTVTTSLVMDVAGTSAVVASETPVHEASEQSVQTLKKHREIPLRDTKKMYRLKDLKDLTDFMWLSIKSDCVRDRFLVMRCGNVVTSFVLERIGIAASLKLRDILKTLIEHKRQKLFRKHRTEILKRAHETWIAEGRVGVKPHSDAYVEGSVAIATLKGIRCKLRFIVEHIVRGESKLYVYEGV